MAEKVREYPDSRDLAPLEFGRNIREEGVLDVDRAILNASLRMGERAAGLEFRDRYSKNMFQDPPYMTKEQIEVDREAIEAFGRILEERRRAKTENSILDSKKIDKIVFVFF